MSNLVTPEVPISKIDVDSDSNVRSHMDEEKLAGLTASVEAVGVMQPVTVRPKAGGRFDLIAGERRYEAAKRAGLKKVPVTLGKDDGRIHLRKLVENIQREELDPIDTARGYLMVKGEMNLKTNKQLAAYAGVNEATIGAYLRLLTLPDGVQDYIAQGAVPIEAERLLRDIAKVSPRIAECICELAKREKYTSRYFTENFGEVFARVATQKFKDKPTMIPVRGPVVSDMIEGKKARAELADRINAFERHWRQGPDPAVPLIESNVDAARALGCLVEHTTQRNGCATVTAFITDKTVAADLALQAVERAEKHAAEVAEKAAEKNTLELEIKKDKRKSAREEAKEKKGVAEFFNEALSGKLFKFRGSANREQRRKAGLNALALILTDNNPTLASGLRLVLPSLQNVDVKTLKSGKEKTTITYSDKEQCTAELLRRVDSANSVGEGIDVLVEAILAGTLVDEKQVAQSKRTPWSIPYRVRGAVEKLLAPDIKAVRPRRRRAATK